MKLISTIFVMIYISIYNFKQVSSWFKPFSSISSRSSSNIIKTVAISGSTGLIGKELVKSLEAKQIKVIRVTTGPKIKDSDIVWSPSMKTITNIESLNEVDAIINLSGENIGSGEGPLAILGRWTDIKKKKIIDSRIDANQLWSETISKLKTKPKVYLAASAIGYYGFLDQETVFDESSKKGQGFAADVCEQTEIEINKLSKQNGIRSCALRFAVILSKNGGVLGKLLLPFSFGAGGVIGSGKQAFSWITINDAVRAIEFCLENSSATGPINISSPSPVTNGDFTNAIGE